MAWAEDFFCISVFYSRPFNTVCTAKVYFHIFYTKHSMKNYSYLDISIVSVFVASKSEETYKKINSILQAAFSELNPDSKNEAEISSEQRSKLIGYERELLEIIDFDFIVEHPHLSFLKICKEENVSETDVENGWELLNSVYNTTLCLIYPYQVLVAVALHKIKLQFHEENPLSKMKLPIEVYNKFIN